MRGERRVVVAELGCRKEERQKDVAVGMVRATAVANESSMHGEACRQLCRIIRILVVTECSNVLVSHHIFVSSAQVSVP